MTVQLDASWDTYKGRLLAEDWFLLLKLAVVDLRQGCLGNAPILGSEPQPVVRIQQLGVSTWNAIYKNGNWGWSAAMGKHLLEMPLLMTTEASPF